MSNELKDLKITVDQAAVPEDAFAAGWFLRADPNYVVLALDAAHPFNTVLGEKMERAKAARRADDKLVYVELAFGETYVRGLGLVSRLGSRASIRPNATLASDGTGVTTWRLVFSRKLGSGWGAHGATADEDDDYVAAEILGEYEEQNAALKAELLERAEEAENVRALNKVLQAKITELEKELAIPVAAP